MTCGEHSGGISDWATDAALGQLHPAQEAKLLAHAGECDACREAYRHAREVAAAVDRGVESLVAGEPSPYFATRLRSRIAAEPVPLRNYGLAWTPVVAGVLALAALVALLLRTPQRTVPRQTTSAGASPARLAGATVSPMMRHSETQPRERHSRVLAAAIQSQEPEVLVPRGQLAAALRWHDAIASGGIDGSRLATSQRAIAGLLEVRDIDAAPLEKPAPIADSVDENGPLLNPISVSGVL